MSAVPALRLTGLTPDAIARECGFERAFRAVQVFQWIRRGARSFSQMSNMPSSERDRLTATFGPLYDTAVEKRADADDGTVKLQVRLSDGAAIECVRLVDPEGRATACLSSQVGCPMGCAFCKTGSLGFRRNLAPHEIVEQLLHIASLDDRPSNIVFMGMGEPLLNLDAVSQAIAVLCHPQGFGYSPRKITVSTCGLGPRIRDLADLRPHVRLAVSLTAADEELRARLMPVTRTCGLAELHGALLYYQQKTGDRITLEVALMADENSDVQDARALLAWIGRLSVQVNLIPWNPVENLPFRRPERSVVERFSRVLEMAGVPVTTRYRKGDSVAGACGQLGDVLS